MTQAMYTYLNTIKEQYIAQSKQDSEKYRNDSSKVTICESRIKDTEGEINSLDTQIQYAKQARASVQLPTGLTTDSAAYQRFNEREVELYKLIDSKAKLVNHLENLKSQCAQSQSSAAKLKLIQEYLNDIEAFSQIWKSQHINWEVRTLSNDRYVISGYGLGRFSEKPYFGQWYYYKDLNMFEPVDTPAQSLLNRINDGGKFN